MNIASLRRGLIVTIAGCLPLAAALMVGDAQAQYKVVGSDGKITYTDRVPPPSDGKATALGGRGTAGPPEVALPTELRQAVSRYPVSLFVTERACAPCDSARQLLRQRGVPYSEKVVATPEDSDALERLTGGRDAPTLTLGAQTLRGFTSELWTSYLDAAGYPRESRLPANYRYPERTPLTQPRESVATRPAPTAQSATNPTPEAPAEPPPAGAGNIKF